MKYEHLDPTDKQITDWLALPRGSKPEDAPTLEALAEKIGIGIATLYRRKAKNDLDQIARGIAFKEIKSYLPSVLHKLAATAMDGSYHHAKLYLELLKEYCPNQVLDLDLDQVNERRSDISKKLKREIEDDTESNNGYDKEEIPDDTDELLEFLDRRGGNR